VAASQHRASPTFAGRRDGALAPSAPLPPRTAASARRRDGASAPSVSDSTHAAASARRRDGALAPSVSESTPSAPTARRRDGALAPSGAIRRQRRRPRLDEFRYTGRYPYHLVAVARPGNALLRPGFPSAIIDAVHRAATAARFDLLAYTVMPDHVHILALGIADDANAVRFMQRFKQMSSYHYAREMGTTLWQQSFFDHVLRREEDVLPIARYILGNPASAGLIRFEEEWPYSGGSLLGESEASSLRHPPDGAKAPSLRRAVAPRRTAEPLVLAPTTNGSDRGR